MRNLRTQSQTILSPLNVAGDVIDFAAQRYVRTFSSVNVFRQHSELLLFERRNCKKKKSKSLDIIIEKNKYCYFYGVQIAKIDKYAFE